MYCFFVIAWPPVELLLIDLLIKQFACQVSRETVESADIREYIYFMTELTWLDIFEMGENDPKMTESHPEPVMVGLIRGENHPIKKNAWSEKSCFLLL